MVSCCVEKCGNIGIFAFPKDEKLQILWKKSLKCKKKETKNLRICSEHFRKEDIEIIKTATGSRRRVKFSAIPFLKDNQQAHQTISKMKLLRQQAPAVNRTLHEISANCNVDKKIGTARKSLFLAVEESNFGDRSIENVEKSLNIENISDLSSQPSNFVIEQSIDAEIITTLPAELMYPINEETVGGVEKARSKSRIISTEILRPRNDICSQFLSMNKTVGTQCSVERRDVGTSPSLSLGLYDISMFEKDDAGILFYTGLESYEKFEFVYRTLADAVLYIQYRHTRVLCVSGENQFFLTLMKLHRNTPDFELSRFFGVSTGTVSNIFVTWVNFVYQLWSQLDMWPSRKLVDFFMPEGFKKFYPKTRAIFDATEMPIAKPSNAKDQQCTFSYYKNKNTYKELIATTPGGLISYCSPAYGGSTSDRQIFERSKIIDSFNEKDTIMADRGFDVQDLCAPKGVTVNIPHFLKGRSQLPGVTVIEDRKLSSKRVHVERSIGLVKTYKILDTPLNPYYVSIAHKIFHICAMLCNFRENIVSKNA